MLLQKLDPSQQNDYHFEWKSRFRSGSIIGSFLSFFLGVGSNYADAVLKGSYMTLDFSAPGAIFLFLVLVGFLNTLFKFTGRSPWIAFSIFLLVAGEYSASRDGRNDQGELVASGVYVYRLRAGRQVETRKLLLLR